MDGASAVGFSAPSPTIMSTGNVVAVNDMYATPLSSIGASALNYYHTGEHLFFEVHCKVQSVTGGQNNCLYFDFRPGTSTGTMNITNWAATVSENTQKGFQSLTNFTPQFLDPQTGAVEIPGV